jgi:hypothetical protein
MKNTSNPFNRVCVAPSRRSPIRRCLQHDSDAQQLLQWISDKGGFIHPVLQLKGREIKAVESIPSSTLVARIPRALLIRTDEPTDPSLDQCIFSKLPQGSSSGRSGAWSYRLAIVLIWLERQARHLFHIRMLPGRARGTFLPRIGFLLDKDLVDEAQYLPLIEAITNQQYFALDFFDSVLSQLPPDHPLYPVTKDEFMWGLSVASSRSFGVTSSSGTMIHAMPPFIDMIDHDASPNVEVSIDPEGDFKLTTKTPLATGQSLRLSYGYLDNLNLILSFGFVMADNPSDQFEFDFSVVLDSITFLDPEVSLPLPSWKVDRLAELGIISSTSDTVAKRVFYRAPTSQDPSPVDSRLLAAIVILRSQDEQQLLRRISKHPLGSWPPEDRQILELLSSLAVALYKGLGSTIQQDMTQRKQLDTQFYDKALMLDFRISIKKTLEKALMAIRTELKQDR